MKRHNPSDKFALIQESLKDFPIGESLTSAIYPILDYVGVRDRLLKNNSLYGRGHLSNWGGRPYEVHSIFQYDLQSFSIDRKKFNSSIVDILKQSADLNFHLFFPSKVLNVQNVENREWHLDILEELTNRKISLRSPFFIDASGRRAQFVRNKGGDNIIYDRLVAAGAFYEFPPNSSIRNQIITETTEDGWWYMNTLPFNKKVLTFMTDIQELNEQCLYNQNVWHNKIKKTSLILNEMNFLKPMDEKIRVYNAYCRRLLNPGNNRWIATGDAACSFDPLSPIGIGNAFLSGIKAAETFKTKNFYEYSNDIDHNFSSYLKNRERIYSLEKRWLNKPFWKKRLK